MIGQTVLHYKILEKLGEGGMGVVYKAEDTKLRRTVAIKMLPDRVQKDAEAKARFLQEAQAAAGLNHPNICTVHGVEEIDGSLFMVMELVAGGTLREKFPFAKIDEAISVAIQIGEALQEAHSKGIVHRDIKADNIMLTAKGQAKVMDFGLAKLKGQLKLTRTSSTVGTLAYMAPEQIQGGQVDARSDIFSFGVLMFEMLTGKLPFRGEHEAAMVYSIINEEPQRITDHLPGVSPIISNLIQRCLEKDADDRYQHLDDIVADLRRSQKKTSRVIRSGVMSTSSIASKASLDSSGNRTDISSKSHSTFRRVIQILVAGLGIAVLSIVLWLFLMDRTPRLNPDARSIRLSINVRQHLFPSISPDGKWLAFMGADIRGRWDLYLRFIETEETRRLTSDSSSPLGPGVLGTDFSPDGGTIAYARWLPSAGSTDICIVSVLGGQTRLVAAAAQAPHWDPEGKRVAFMRLDRNYAKSSSGYREYWSVRSDGTDERLEFIDSLGFRPTGNYDFSWSPDGGSLVYNRTLGLGRADLILHPLDGSPERPITTESALIDEMSWLANGFILCSWWKGGSANLWLISEDGKSTVQLTHTEGVIGSSISADMKRLVYFVRKPKVNLWRAGSDDDTPQQITAHGNLPYFTPDISPDKSQFAFVERSLGTISGGRMTISLVDRTGENKRNLVLPPDTGDYLLPLFSPDGRWIVYTHRLVTLSSDDNRIFLVDRQGSAFPKFVCTGRLAHAWQDDKTLIVLRNDGSYLVSTESREEHRLSSDSTIARPVLAGRFVALWKIGSNDIRIAGWDGTSTLQETSGRVIASLDKHRIIQYRFGEKYMTYVDTDRGAWKVDYVTGRHTRMSAIPTDLMSSIVVSSYDGAELAILTADFETELVMIESPFK